MRLQTVSPRQGSAWVRRGFRAFFVQPLAFSALFATFLFFAFLVAFVPLAGPIVAVGVLPLVSAGFMIATRLTLDARFPTPRVFVEPLRGERSRRNAMIWLCVAYAVATVVVMWLADVLDGGSVEDLMEGMVGGKLSSESAAAQVAADPRIEFGMLLRFGLTALLSVPFWHAPALVYWEGQGCAQALFSSTLACWRNKGAFFVYGLYWFAVVMMIALVASLVAALLGAAQLMALLLAPLSLLLSTVFYASLYFTFADCFAADEPAPPLPPPERNPS